MTQLNNNFPHVPEPEPPVQGPERFAKAVGLYVRALLHVSGYVVAGTLAVAAVLVALGGIWWALKRALIALGLWSD